jgi:hypothetical protein
MNIRRLFGWRSIIVYDVDKVNYDLLEGRIPKSATRIFLRRNYERFTLVGALGENGYYRKIVAEVSDARTVEVDLKFVSVKNPLCVIVEDGRLYGSNRFSRMSPTWYKDALRVLSKV